MNSDWTRRKQSFFCFCREHNEVSELTHNQNQYSSDWLDGGKSKSNYCPQLIVSCLTSKFCRIVFLFMTKNSTREIFSRSRIQVDVSLVFPGVFLFHLENERILLPCARFCSLSFRFPWKFSEFYFLNRGILSRYSHSNPTFCSHIYSILSSQIKRLKVFYFATKRNRPVGYKWNEMNFFSPNLELMFHVNLK